MMNASPTHTDSSLVTPKGTEPLQSYTWKNRLILLFTPSVDHPAYQRQLNSLGRHTYALQDRDLKVLHAAAAGEINVPAHQSQLHRRFPDKQSQKIYSEFDVSADSFTLLLIGKDGTVKMRRTRLVDPQVIFDRIDQMPMRRREMQEK